MRETEPTIPQYDLLIVGGGINGAGIACDAAGRGLKVALIEQADLASATSQASSKMIHGGLRYLEFYEFRLVRESLGEREVMLSKAPHLIRPLRIVLPHRHQIRPAWMVRIGLFLYDHLARHPRLPNSTGINLNSHDYGKPLVSDVAKGFAYSDCWADDARLVVANARAAADNGGVIKTGTRLLHAARVDGLWQAQLEDQETGERTTVIARGLVNATGPWVQPVLQETLQLQTDKRTTLVKGSHIVVPKLYDGDHGYLLQNPDNRVVFVLPFERDYTMIGTTEAPIADDPGSTAVRSPKIDPAESRYLCDTVNAYFKTQIAADDIVWSFAGVRPLFDDGDADPSKISRDYVLELRAQNDRAPALSVFGGKITTYRRLAEEALEKLRPFFPNMGPSWTATTPLPGGDVPGEDFARFCQDLTALYPALDPDYLQHLARRHGSHCRDLLATVETVADLGQDFGGGLYQIEVDYLRRYEWAKCADDILWRRTKCGLHMTVDQRQAVADYFQAL